MVGQLGIFYIGSTGGSDDQANPDPDSTATA